MLSSSLCATLSVADLRASFETMVDDFAHAPTNVVVMTTLDQWPEKTDHDVGWAYVVIDDATSSSEGVAVVVTLEDGQRVIPEVSWGRP